MSTATCPQCGYNTGWNSDHAFCIVNGVAHALLWKQAVENDGIANLVDINTGEVTRGIEAVPITTTEAAEPTLEYATVEYAKGYETGYAAGAKAQRQADANVLHADGWFHAGNIVDNQPLVTDDTPEPEPLTASEALEHAASASRLGSEFILISPATSTILWAAYQYAKSNPEWFRDWGKCDDPSDALESAQHFAYADDMVAWHVLSAAKRVAADNPDLFGGEA